MIFSSTASAEIYHWLQYGPAGLEARVITDAASCPVARVDESQAAMGVRAAPGGQYPITVCALQVPADAKSVLIRAVPVALPVSEPNRIAVIGDTGCRMKGPFVQACNVPAQWPFRLIAEVIAQMQPDLVIHVGDYHYRETPCPSETVGCGGSPAGDTWYAWRADFFAPADTLLKVSPWVFVRGNHEECHRGGQGWSRFLEPYAFDDEKACNGVGKPFVVPLRGLTLAVMDVSSAREERVDRLQAQTYREQYKSLAETTSGPTWILQHRPIWSVGGAFGGKLVGDNKTLAAAAAGVIPDNAMLMLSGHHHLFQVLNYESDLPVQVVSGHGGDFLNIGYSSDPKGWTINRVKVKSGLNIIGAFGFLMLEKRNDGWQLTNYDKFGGSQNSCFLKTRSATCPAG
jgi:Calcineurin-like phosphoesterase